MLFEWRRDHISTIFEDAILAAFENWTSGKKRVVNWMLTKPGFQIPITESVVQAAAANKVSGMEMMFLLLKRRGDQIPISENVVRAAAANDICGNVTMALLFNERRDRLPITADVSQAAAVNGYEMMSFLLDRWGDRVPITERVMQAAAGNSRDGHEVMDLLWSRRGDQVPLLITKDVLRAAIRNRSTEQENLSGFSTAEETVFSDWSPRIC